MISMETVENISLHSSGLVMFPEGEKNDLEWS